MPPIKGGKFLEWLRGLANGKTCMCKLDGWLDEVKG